MNTVYTAIAIFGMTAILGMYLISLVLREKKTPRGVAIFHGLFAVTGLLLLIAYSTGDSPGPIASIIIFSIAAFGGIILIYKDVSGSKVPKGLAVAHGLTAITGFALLIWFVCCPN